LVCFGALVALVGTFYAEEDWRGQRDWNQYREATEARGESLDLRSYIPKPVPEEDNFAEAPIVKSLFGPNAGKILTNDLYAHAANNIPETDISWDKAPRHFLDLVAWQMASAALQSGPLKPEQNFKTDKTDLAARAVAAPAVLEGMKPDAAEFAELRAASTRPYSRYPLFYDMENPWSILLPHQGKIKELCNRLSLEACAELAVGQPDQALADVKLMLSLADSIKSDPFIISALVRAACVGIVSQPVWEGLAEHRWNDAQLQELQARFLSYDLLTDMQQPLKEERVVGVLAVDRVMKQGIGRFFPTGWWYEEKLNYDSLIDLQMKGVVNLAAKTISPFRSESNAKEKNRHLDESSGSDLKAILHHHLIASMMEPALNRVYVRIAESQITADQAALGCALERYRLANGQFPETLSALTPQFMPRLPNDVITGQPYKYRRTDDGQYVLYSVGWNERDDGGVPGKRLFDEQEGDWVWDYRPS